MKLKAHFILNTLCILMLTACNSQGITANTLPVPPTKTHQSSATSAIPTSDKLTTGAGQTTLETSHGLQITYSDLLEVDGEAREGIYGVEVSCLETKAPCFGQPELITMIPTESGAPLRRVDEFEWSANGKKIVIAKEIPNNRRDLLMYDVDLERWVNLTNSLEDEFSPSWSPTEEEIVFSSCRYEPVYTCDSYQFDLHAAAKEPLFHQFSMMTKEVRWTPDGENLIFLVRDEAGYHHIWISKADGTEAFQVSQKTSGDISKPVMLADLGTIFYEQKAFQYYDFVMIQRDGSRQQILTSGYSSYSTNPNPDPIGKWVAYFFRDDLNGGSQVYLLSIEGRVIFPAFHSDAVNPQLEWRRYLPNE